MSAVQIYVQIPQQRRVVGALSVEKAKLHSATLRELLDHQSMSNLHKITLTGAAPAALRFCLERMETSRAYDLLHVKVHLLPLANAVAIHEAALLLRLEPAQDHIHQHILGYVSRNITSGAEIVVIHKVYKSDESKIWRAMVHQTAWNILHGKIADEQLEEMETAAKPYPKLHAAVDAKIAELAPKKEHYDRIQAQKAEKGIVGDDAKCLYKTKQELVWEEENGLRTLSEARVKEILKKGSWWN